MWKQTASPTITLPDILQHEWFQSGEIQWIDEQYPDNVTSLLVEEIADDLDEYGSDQATGDETDDE